MLITNEHLYINVFIKDEHYHVYRCYRKAAFMENFDESRKQFFDVWHMPGISLRETEIIDKNQSCATNNGVEFP
jgi:hypothetical protein